MKYKLDVIANLQYEWLTCNNSFKLCFTNVLLFYFYFNFVRNNTTIWIRGKKEGRHKYQNEIIKAGDTNCMKSLKIRSCKSKTDIQCNGQKKKDKRTHNCLQTITQKTKDRVTRIPLKTGDEIWCTGKVSSSCSTCGTLSVTLCYKPDEKS
jgi:hypothetical protein